MTRHSNRIKKRPDYLVEDPDFAPPKSPSTTRSHLRSPKSNVARLSQHLKTPTKKLTHLAPPRPPYDISSTGIGFDDLPNEVKWRILELVHDKYDWTVPAVTARALRLVNKTNAAAFLKLMVRLARTYTIMLNSLGLRELAWVAGGPLAPYVQRIAIADVLVMRHAILLGHEENGRRYTTACFSRHFYDEDMARRNAYCNMCNGQVRNHRVPRKEHRKFEHECYDHFKDVRQLSEEDLVRLSAEEEPDESMYHAVAGLLSRFTGLREVSFASVAKIKMIRVAADGQEEALPPLYTSLGYGAEAKWWLRPGTSSITHLSSIITRLPTQAGVMSKGVFGERVKEIEFAFSRTKSNDPPTQADFQTILRVFPYVEHLKLSHKSPAYWDKYHPAEKPLKDPEEPAYMRTAIARMTSVLSTTPLTRLQTFTCTTYVANAAGILRILEAHEKSLVRIDMLGQSKYEAGPDLFIQQLQCLERMPRLQHLHIMLRSFSDTRYKNIHMRNHVASALSIQQQQEMAMKYFEIVREGGES